MLVPAQTTEAERPSARATIDLSVVVVNYNGERWLGPCLRSLWLQFDALAEAGMQAECIIVDNGSSDGSLALLAREFPQARLLANDANRGFAAANNQGFQAAQGDCVLLLNTDTVFYSGLARLLELARSRPQIGAAGPGMVDGQAAPRDSWGYFPTLGRLALTMFFLDRLARLTTAVRPFVVRPHHKEFRARWGDVHAVDWASGACLLIRRDVLEQVGPLDERIFMYNEEVEWCYRARQAGYAIMVTPHALVAHWGAGGGEWRQWKGPDAVTNAYRSFLYLFHKHAPAWQGPLLRLVLAAGAVLRLGAGIVLWATSRGEARSQARRIMAAYVQVLRILTQGGQW
jgi:GT2 family glycosyltransferase